MVAGLGRLAVRNSLVAARTDGVVGAVKLELQELGEGEEKRVLRHGQQRSGP